MKVSNQFISPIFSLRNSIRKSLAYTISKKISKDIEKIISVNLTPSHIEGDYTFPVFEIAQLLGVDYSMLASNIAKNLSSQNKYIHGVEIVNGYVNITVNNNFYRDGLRYVLNTNLLRAVSKNKHSKKILLLLDQIKVNEGSNQSVFQFIKLLYSLPPHVVKTAAINDDTTPYKSRSFLQKTIKNGNIRNFGNNVIAVQLPKERYALLQRQDKTPTLLMHQLITLGTLIKKNKPAIIIFSMNTTPQKLDELLASAHALKIFKKREQLLVINDADFVNKINLHDLYNLKKLQMEIGEILQNIPDIKIEDSLRFNDTEITLARLISYSPEVFRQLFLQSYPEVIIRYTEILKKPIHEFYRLINNFPPFQTTVSSKLLLHASYKILDISLSLIKK